MPASCASREISSNFSASVAEGRTLIDGPLERVRREADASGSAGGDGAGAGAGVPRGHQDMKENRDQGRHELILFMQGFGARGRSFYYANIVT